MFELTKVSDYASPRNTLTTNEALEYAMSAMKHLLETVNPDDASFSQPPPPGMNCGCGYNATEHFHYWRQSLTCRQCGEVFEKVYTTYTPGEARFLFWKEAVAQGWDWVEKLCPTHNVDEAKHEDSPLPKLPYLNSWLWTHRKEFDLAEFDNDVVMGKPVVHLKDVYPMQVQAFSRGEEVVLKLSGYQYDETIYHNAEQVEGQFFLSALNIGSFEELRKQVNMFVNEVRKASASTS